MSNIDDLPEEIREQLLHPEPVSKNLDKEWVELREQEILHCHDEEGLSFRKMAKMFDLSVTRVSQIYRDALRKERALRRKEIFHGKNLKTVSLDLQRGEAIILKQLLEEYLQQRFKGLRVLTDKAIIAAMENEDIDYITAKRVSRSLAHIIVQSKGPSSPG